MDKSIISAPSAYGHRGGYRPAVHLCEADVQRAIQAYQGGASLPKAGALVGVSKFFLREIFKQRGVARRTPSQAHRVYALDEHAFDDAANDEQAAYFVGLLFSDGCVKRTGEKQATITLSLSGDDGRHVAAFRSFLKSDSPLGQCRHGINQLDRLLPSGNKPIHLLPFTRLRVSSCILADALARYGVVPRKSRTATASGGMETNPHFWRGVLDGDGTYYVLTHKHDGRRYPYVELVGSFQAMTQFSAYVKALTGRASKPSFKSEFCWRVAVSSRHAVRLILEMHRGCTVALPRKKAIADAMLLEFPEGTFRGNDWREMTAEMLLEHYRTLGSWLKVANKLKTCRTHIDRLRRRLGLLAGKDAGPRNELPIE